MFEKWKFSLRIAVFWALTLCIRFERHRTRLFFTITSKENCVPEHHDLMCNSRWCHPRPIDAHGRLLHLRLCLLRLQLFHDCAYVLKPAINAVNLSLLDGGIFFQIISWQQLKKFLLYVCRSCKGPNPARLVQSLPRSNLVLASLSQIASFLSTETSFFCARDPLSFCLLHPRKERVSNATMTCVRFAKLLHDKASCQLSSLRIVHWRGKI